MTPPATQPERPALARARVAPAPPARADGSHAPGPAPERTFWAHRSDEDLAAMAQEGSRAAFGELAERFGGRLTGFLVRRTRSGEAAEDLAQETLARAWQSLSRYDRTRRFSTWIFTIANRLAIDHYREGGRERAGLGVERAGQPDPTCAERHELSGRLWTIAQRVLTPEQTSALWLRYGADLDIGDIARVLGRTSVGVRVLLFRARERLAHELTEHEARRPVPAGIESKRSGGAP